MTFAEWTKKKKEEEEKQKAELTAQEKAMGGISNTNEAKGISFAEWTNRVKGTSTATEDIAPVAGGNKDTWFKASEGDVGQTILGTAGDVGLGLGRGILRLAEGILDIGAYIDYGIGSLVGNDDFAQFAREMGRVSLVDEATRDAVDYVDRYSVLGNKSDSVAEGLGQVGGIILTGGIGASGGLGAAGVTALTTATTGLSSMGNNMGEAYSAGATGGQGFLYGLSTGAIEAGTELLFGGLGKGVKALGISRGIGGVDDMLAKGLSNKITKLIAKDGVKKVVGNTIEALVKATGEGVEEVASGLGSALMKKLTYASEEEWEKLVADENLLESFVVGALTSSIVQGGDLVKANANKTDFVTGMTSAEEKVINKAAEKEIAQKEANGEKLSKKDKNEIYDRLTEDISRGYISIDTIEETLGGDKYTEYKKASDENAALKKELDELRNMESGKMNDIQRERLTELKAMNLDDTSKIDELKKQMSDDVLNLVKSERKGKGSLLMESYNEKTRLGQGFVANYDSIKGKKYEDAARQTIDNAVKAGANNSNRVHDLVDMAAKLSSETGIVYKFGGNEAVKADFIQLQNENLAKLEAIENPNETQLKEIDKIKELIRKVESGETKVNGNFTGKGIMLNLDSPKLLNTVVGHEMTHTLEQTKHYEALQKALFTYAKTKGVDIDAKVAELTELYKGVEGADAKAELTADLIGDYLFNDYDFVKTLAKDRNVFQKMWDRVKYLGKLATAGSKEARELARVERMFAKAYQESQGVSQTKDVSTFPDADGNPIETERISTDENDNQYSLSHNSEIAEGQTKFVVDPNKKSYITEAELAEAQRVTNAMVDVMIKYSNILPEDKIGKVLTDNGSYDRSVENTTICVRTLAYNEFVDKVQEEIGRPLSQMESFLVSQKLYDIATDPQCMYCYVSLDRKAFNNMLLRYMQDRDTVIDKYNKSDKTPEAIEALYKEFLNFRNENRKPTKPMRARFDSWISYVDNGTQMLSLADIATEDRQSVIKANGGSLADQLADARKYAQAASWAKIQKNYVAYRDEILKLGDRVVKNLNEHYGLRWYSFSDYSAAFIVENMQQITDASIRGLKGLAYTKDTDFAEIYAPSGMNINVSVFVNQDENGNFYIDEKQSADFEKAKDLRDRYPNVGIVATVTNDEALRWAGSQEWSDVVIPFHVVRTGADVAEYYKWLNYTSESGDTVADKDLWNAYLDSLNKTTESARNKVSKNVYPSEHHNDKNTYLNLCESRGLTPRFARFAGEDWYMKLVNETRLSADESSPLKPIYNEEAAKASFQKFVDKGGYEGGWYKDGVDVDAEAKAVAEDVLAGKKANEVLYGRQDGFAPESLIASRKTNRTHGQHSLSTENVTNPIGHRGVLGSQFRVQENIAPLAVDNIEAPTSLNGVDNTVGGVDSNQTVSERIAAQIENFRTELDNDIKHRENAIEDFDISIAMAQAEYDALKNKTTRKANDILRRIERLERLKSNVDADFQNRINNLQQRIDKLGTVEYKRAEQRRAKQQTYTEETSELMGDTSTWVDKKLGISYQTNTLRRNLRDIVRDANGNKDIAKADAIYDYLQGTYNHNEAKLKQESREIKQPFADMKINKYESAYAQMLGELRHNPQTTLTKDEVNKYLQNHKGKIDTKKVDKIISEARKVYDDLIKRVNEVLREQGMREIAYREGYFPHFTEDKQSFLGKLFNWKTKNDDIPTDIAGLTETFEPVRSYQSFNKQRTTDKTDYNFKKGFDTYVHGALDWIYHIEDIQKRRAFENEIRYRHSEQGVQNKIDEIKANTEYDADEAQRQIDSVFEEARNPLNNFVTDFRRATQTLAGKKSSADREMEYSTNRKIYSTMTNISNRVSANMVAGSISSALTNFIPITQSWSQVSPIRTLQAMRDTVRNYVRDDGTIMESDFLTNRLLQEENLDKTAWDHVSDKVGFLMETIDGFTSQVVWRSKYLDNIKKGMSEGQAIANADAFAEGLMAGRSRGNMPTIFDSKNPITKMFTAFQLEVANQYGYMFKDMPNEIGKKHMGKLLAGYAGMFIGANVYNALFSALTGRDAAFDPMGILYDLLKDLGFGDDEEEEADVLGAVANLAENVAQEIPFVGGLLGGGRVPISSAMPYNMDFSEAWTDIEGMVTAEDNDKYTKSFINELLKPVWYVGLPMGGGQIKKTIEGLSMFSDDHPVAGSYTDSGNLRYPVEDTLWNRVQAALFGQYANENARYYFDNDLAPLKENQIQEYEALGMSYQDYWGYRDEMTDITKRGKEEGATNDDIIKSKYIESVSSQLSEVQSEKKKVMEDTTLTERAKQAKLDELNKQYNELAQERYDSYNNISYDGNYASIGGNYYEWYTPEDTSKEPEWRKLNDDQALKYQVTRAAGNAHYATNGTVHYKLELGGDWRNISDWKKISDSDLEYQNEVTKALGITPDELWSETGTSFIPTKTGEYDYAYKYPKQYSIAKSVGYDTYRQYSSAINDIEGTKDANGKTISGSRKEPVKQYLESLDIPYGAKIILYRNEFKGDDTYNYDIVRYLESLDNLTYEEKLETLRALDFDVDDNGNIWW